MFPRQCERCQSRCIGAVSLTKPSLTASENTNGLESPLRRLGYVPVIEIDHADDAVPLAEALLAGGVGCIEVTCTPASLPSIAEIVNSGLPMMVGVGTVTHADQVHACVDAGAQFAVSPGYARDWPRLP